MVTTQPPPAHDGDPTLVEVTVRATHNSYAGDHDGARGSLVAQLDAGVRLLEFDLHDDGYVEHGDHVLGHLLPGQQVWHEGGNPASDLLDPWLRLVDDWSRAHPGHHPLVLTLDLKNDLSDPRTPAEGNLTALNQHLRAVFGARLLTAAELPDPARAPVRALRGRVVVVLSGSYGARSAYVHDTGVAPAVAVDARGRLVQVHDSGRGHLWYWTGRLADDGTATFTHHGRLDEGTTPAVLLADDGTVLEVHRSETRETLWSRTGHLADDGSLTWHGAGAEQFDLGAAPTLHLAGGGLVVERHRAPDDGPDLERHGVLADGRVHWQGEAAPAAGPRFDPATGTGGGFTVTVASVPGPFDPCTLTYRTDPVGGGPGVTGPVRHDQVAHVEYQWGDPAELLSQAPVFWGGPAHRADDVARARAAGKLVRAWGVGEEHLGEVPGAVYPATDHLFADWYLQRVPEVR